MKSSGRRTIELGLAALGTLVALGMGPVSAQTGQPLVGRWQGEESVLQINADGTLLIDQTRYRYTVAGNEITLIGYDGSMQVPFKLEGDRLTVLFAGQVVTMQRVAAGADPGGRAAGTNVPVELSGKWCYFSNFNATSGGGSMTDECFTIYANGRYQYHRESSMSVYASGAYGSQASSQDDSGTWSLQGSTLKVNSRTQGPVSYNLVKRNHPKNNDPMLCIDGRCFVTYGPKPPWR